MKKILLAALIPFAILTTRCNEPSNQEAYYKNADTLLPILRLKGNPIDTAYVLVPYVDEGVSINKFNSCYWNSDENTQIETTGRVDVTVPGTYTLTYNATNAKGYKAKTVTRIVHVVDNPNGFLSGVYNVACTCTASLKGTTTPTISTSNYTAIITPKNTPNLYQTKNYFEISTFQIGDKTILPQLTVSGNTLHLNFYDRDYHWNHDNIGIVSPSKDEFTITLSTIKWTPVTNFTCTNVFKKQLTLSSTSEK